MINKKTLVYLLIGLFLLTGVFAFNYNGNSVDNSYAEGEIIRGTINISFDNDLAEGLFTSNLNGSSTLLEILQANDLVVGEDYNCSSPNCLSDYISSGETTGFILDGNKVVGFKISGGDITGIDSTKFNVKSDEPASCVSPLKIDVLNDEKDVLINNKYTDYAGCFNPDYGCFDSGASTSFVEISNNLYCENITLPVGPAYKIGARIKNTTSGSADLEMQLLTSYGNFLDKCDLPANSQDEEDLSCVVNYTSSEKKNFLVCVRQSNPSGNPDYKIKSETEGKICGTDNQGSSYTRDYEIFGEMMRFGVVDLNVDDDLFNSLYGQTLSSYIYGYIYDNYNGYCLPSCIVPISFSGLGGQSLTFGNVEIKYKDGNTIVSGERLYNVAKDSVKVSSGELNLNLENASFVIPKKGDATKFKLYLDGRKILEEPISISESFDFDINPKFVAFGQNTLFEATDYGNVSIINSKWDFDDGNVENSDSGKINYAYLKQGNFNLEVSLTREDNITSVRTFQITVGDVKEIAKDTLKNYDERIVKLKSIIDSYPSWIKKVLEDKLDLVAMESDLEGLQKDYDNSSNDDDYANVMVNLLDSKIPYSINVSKSGKLPIYVGGENVYPGYIEEISSEKTTDRDKLKEDITGWMQENVDGTIDFEQISAFYDSGSEVLTSKFSLDVNSKSNETSYLVIGYSFDGITFENDYGERKLEGGTYISLGKERRVFNFVISDGIEPDELGIYVSPVVSLVKSESVNVSEPEKKKFSWTIFLVGLFIVLIFGFASYIFLQEWYKKNYERTLFKSNDELYNLINFINNARKSGIKDRELKLKLRQNKWENDKINYAIRKLDGKRTGMYEIPIFRFWEKKKLKNELLKRKGLVGRQNIY